MRIHTVTLLITFVLLAPALCSNSTIIEDAASWCEHYRNPLVKTMDQAFDFPHLMEHMNEDFRKNVPVTELSDWFAVHKVPLANRSENAFLQFCSGLYSQLMEIYNSTTTDEQKTGINIFQIPLKVWTASFISIFVISTVGLLGVGIVPLTQKMFYNQIIQYLVALAVGTLTGDAFLHLMPHAITAGAGHSHEAGGGAESQEAERQAVFKGLVALGGVYFFFMAEKSLGFISEYRSEKKLEKEDRERALLGSHRSMEVRRMSTVQPHLAKRGSIAGGLLVPGQIRRLSQLDPSLCRRASRAVSIANEDIMTTGLSSKAMRSIDILYRFAAEDDMQEEMEARLLSEEAAAKEKAEVKRTDDGTGDRDQAAEITLSVPKVVRMADDKKGQEEEFDRHQHHPHHHEDHGDHHHHTEDNEKGQEDSNTKSDKQKHGHGHSHEVPASVASVAWMVILGDGLHNFTDGMAIGAAFAQSISGGLSTSVAVFCHELPHELGDFAVLLKTGMRIKEALFFNVVSSVLSLLGMIVGIAVGNVESASYWIFAVTAGTFIYIALVDMLPELSSAELRPGQTRIGQMVVQAMGLTTGVSIMLTIALFEDKIRVIVD